jgi:DNA-binding NarL/FixJ family response regulator
VRLALSARGYCLTDVLGNVNTPTLVFAGRNQINPAVLATAQEIASAIPDGRLVLFDGYRLSNILSAPDQQLPPAVRVIEEFLSNLSNSRQELTDTPWGTDAGLSQREIEVLRLLAAGKSNQQIADALVISLNTVLRHVSNIFAKTGAANRTEAAGYARDRSLI